MTKLELATAIVNIDSRKNWASDLKKRDIGRLMRHNSKAELQSLYEYKLEQIKKYGFVY